MKPTYVVNEVAISMLQHVEFAAGCCCPTYSTSIALLQDGFEVGNLVGYGRGNSGHLLPGDHWHILRHFSCSP